MPHEVKPIDTVLTPETTVACPACGGFLFFDWGLKILDTAYKSVTPRFQGAATNNNLLICAGCHHPIAQIGVDYFDAGAIVTTEQVDHLIRMGRSREHVTPVPVMDP